MTDNLALWSSVEKTDPSRTKAFSRGGGFRGTAVNATWLAKMATEKFGPCGIGWGVAVLDEKFVEGAPLKNISGREIVHRVHVRLWYIWKGKKGEIEHFGQTTFVGENKNGPFTDEEAPKKSLTDAMTKALSLLGFAADVHLGLFDDNRYVRNLKHEFAERDAVPAASLPSPADAEPVFPGDLPMPGEDEPSLARMAAELAREIERCTTVPELQALVNSEQFLRRVDPLSNDQQQALRNAFAKKRARLVALTKHNSEPHTDDLRMLA